MKESGKIPITVGIVGHLDAIITPEHKQKIENDNWYLLPLTLTHLFSP